MRIKDPVTLAGWMATLVLGGVAAFLYLPDMLGNKTIAPPEPAAPVAQQPLTTPAQPTNTLPVASPAPQASLAPAPPAAPDEEAMRRELQQLQEQLQALEQENARLEQEVSKAAAENQRLGEEIDKIRPQ